MERGSILAVSGEKKSADMARMSNKAVLCQGILAMYKITFKLEETCENSS